MDKLKNEGERLYLQKLPRDGDGNNGLEVTSYNGDYGNGICNSNYEQDPLEDENNTESNGSKSTLSEDGEAFLELVLDPTWTINKSKKAKVYKYRQPDTK